MINRERSKNNGAPMSVHVKLSTTLRDCCPGYDPVAGLDIPLPRPVSAGELALSLGLPLDQIKIVMINRMHAPLDRIVNDGDRVAYFPAVGGG